MKVSLFQRVKDIMKGVKPLFIKLAKSEVGFVLFLVVVVPIISFILALVVRLMIYGFKIGWNII